jgi:hypothetical protein
MIKLIMRIITFQRNRKGMPGYFDYGVVGKNTNNMYSLVVGTFRFKEIAQVFQVSESHRDIE